MTDLEKQKYIGQTIVWMNFDIKAKILNVDYTGFIIQILEIDSKSSGRQWYEVNDILHIPADTVLKFV